MTLAELRAPVLVCFSSGTARLLHTLHCPQTGTCRQVTSTKGPLWPNLRSRYKVVYRLDNCVSYPKYLLAHLPRQRLLFTPSHNGWVLQQQRVAGWIRGHMWSRVGCWTSLLSLTFCIIRCPFMSDCCPCSRFSCVGIQDRFMSGYSASTRKSFSLY